MNTRIAAVLFTACLTLLASGCSPYERPPTYEQVTREATDALAEIVRQVDIPIDVVHLDDLDPYPCGDNLSLGLGDGYFYTGNWEVHLKPETDLAYVVRQLLPRLGENWSEMDIGLPHRDDSIHIEQHKPPVQVAVSGVRETAGSYILLTAISRCGVEEQPTP